MNPPSTTTTIRPETAYSIDDGQVIPENESRLARTLRQKKALKENRGMMRIVQRIRENNAKSWIPPV